MQLIEAQKLLKKWKREGEGFILGPIDLSLKIGDILLISGSNGSGKSTLLACLAHLIKPDKGEVIWGEDITEDDVLFMNQNYHQLCLPWYTCRKNLTLVKPPRSHGSSVSSDESDMLPPLLKDKLENPIYLMSGGEKQAMVMTRVLARRKKIVLLDEPFSNLDVDTTKFYTNILKRDCEQKKCLYVVVAHNPPETFYRTREIYLTHGSLSSADKL